MQINSATNVKMAIHVVNVDILFLTELLKINANVINVLNYILFKYIII